MSHIGMDTRTVRRGLSKTNWIFPHPHCLTHILDLGAYVGLASLVYRTHWPRAFIRAVEPDREALAILRENLRPWYVEIQAGAFGDGRYFRDATPRKLRRIAHRYVPAATPDMERDVLSKPLSEWCQTMPRWRRRAGVLVKMDIEGAERFLFASPEECAFFREHVDALHMEVHPGCLDPAVEFFDSLQGWNIRCEVDGNQGRFWGSKE